MAKPNDTATFLASVFDASRKSGNATQELVAIIKARKINWSNDDTVKPLRREFYLGRVAASLDVDRVMAIACIDLTKFKQGDNSDKRRTLVQERAYRAAKSAWSHVALLAGEPSKQTGLTRAPKTRTPKMKGTKSATTTNPAITGNTATDLITGKVTIPAAAKIEDVRAFALRCASLMETYMKRNQKLIPGDTRNTFEAFIKSVHAEPAKPRVHAEPAKPRVPVQANVVLHALQA